MTRGIILKGQAYVLKRRQRVGLWEGKCYVMKMKKSILLLAFAILCIIAGSHFVSNKLSSREGEGTEPNTSIQPEADSSAIPPIDDETFIDTSDTIRVALHTTGFASLYHSQVKVSCDVPYEVITEDGIVEKEAGEVMSFSKVEEETKISPMQKEGRITLLSIKRNSGTPSYRGTITLHSKNGKIIVVNELSMEEYLYGVLPSEMPANYGAEALKLQAVCARSYAMREKNESRYEEFYADVVDSTASQVYNNTKEDGRANQAVRDTKGEILVYEDEIASTYFFSTSYGYTTNSGDVWYQSRKESSPAYLTGKFQGEEELELNLKKESDFRAFLDHPDFYDTFEQEEAWYRWTVKTTLSQISKTLSANYPKEMKKIGAIKKLVIADRGVGGVAKICKVVGTKGSFVIEKENAIRKAFAVSGTKAIGQNKTEMTISSLLPSGYFYIEQKGKNVIFHGGGFGHGVGMSQTGARNMAELGYTWEEMAEHYFPGVSIESCY